MPRSRRISYPFCQRYQVNTTKGRTVLPQQEKQSQQDHGLVQIPPILPFPLAEQKKDQPQKQKLLQSQTVPQKGARRGKEGVPEGGGAR